MRALAGQFNVSRQALQRHVDHISDLLSNADKASTALRRKRLFTALCRTHATTRALLAQAIEMASVDTGLRAIARLEKQLELHARLTGDLKEQGAEVTAEAELTAEQWAALHELIGKTKL